MVIPGFTVPRLATTTHHNRSHAAVWRCKEDVLCVSSDIHDHSPATMMNLGRTAVRAGMRQCRHRRLYQPCLSYHSYPLPSAPKSGLTDSGSGSGSISSATITSPPLPRVHETRPPPQHETVPTPPPLAQPTPDVAETQPQPVSASPQTRPRPKLRARKAAMKLTPAAVEHLRELVDLPEPKLIKVGVRNRGCSGLAYHLEYVDKAGAFDETVEQDGVRVLIDSKALFSIIGSEMDWEEDKLSQRFVFKNPNIKEACGCGESFMV